MRVTDIGLVFWETSIEGAQNFIEKFNSIIFEWLIYAKVKIFMLDGIHNNFNISYLSSIPCLANKPYSSIFSDNFLMDYWGVGFE